MKNYSYQWNHDDGENSFTYLFNSLKKKYSIESNKSLIHLDLGCGNGFLTNHISTFFKETHGYDVSESGINLAKKRNNLNVKYFLTDKNLSNIEKNYYDIVTLLEVIEHVYDPHEFLVNIKSKMKKKGKIIISTPFHGYFKNLAIALTNKFDHHFNPLWLHGHIKFFSKRTIIQILEDNGFKINTIYYSGRFYPLSKSMIIEAIND
tara:strand:+ start:32 stop:649 length:618 start_codon:yes stop_codon:yes gene_type:complete